jgi:hypothetical protein
MELLIDETKLSTDETTSNVGRNKIVVRQNETIIKRMSDKSPMKVEQMSTMTSTRHHE